MAYTTEHLRSAGHAPSDYYHSAKEWVLTQYRAYRHHRELVHAEAQLRGFSDQLLADVGLSRGEIHDAVWNGRTTHRR